MSNIYTCKLNVYTCKLRKNFVEAYADSELELNPENYLYCDDEYELRDAIEDDLYDAMNTGDVEYDYSESEMDIPDEFIAEWKKLKGNG